MSLYSYSSLFCLYLHFHLLLLDFYLMWWGNCEGTCPQYVWTSCVGCSWRTLTRVWAQAKPSDTPSSLDWCVCVCVCVCVCECVSLCFVLYFIECVGEGGVSVTSINAFSCSLKICTIRLSVYTHTRYYISSSSHTIIKLKRPNRV